MTHRKRSVSPIIPRLYGHPASRRLAIAILAAALAASAPHSAPAGPVPPPHNIDLFTLPYSEGGHVILGENRGVSAAFSVSAAGDVNGDGLADVIVGAPYFYESSPAKAPGGDYLGRAYVVFGNKESRGGFYPLEDVVGGTGGFVINPERYGYALGFSAAQAGDVNGDGFGDVIVGAPFSSYQVYTPGYCAYGYTDGYGNYICSDYRGPYSYGYYGIGRAYVVYGKPDTNPVDCAAISAGLGGFAIEGADEYDYLGFSVSGAGDVNGDGFSDIIVGAPYADSNYGYPGEEGAAFLIFGASTTPSSPVYSNSIGSSVPGFAIRGETYLLSGFSYSGAGSSVSGAGDVNGDGLADLIVGAPSTNSSLGPPVRGEKLPAPPSPNGRAFVIFGKSDTNAVELDTISAGSGGGFTIFGPNHPNSYFGSSVSTAGDVDGDGFSDIIIGAPGFYPPTGRAARHGTKGITPYSIPGAAFICRGKTDPSPVSAYDLGSGNGGFAVIGSYSVPGERAGTSVSLAGDINGDGLSDVIIGSPYGFSNTPYGYAPAGNAYVVFGAQNNATINTYEVFNDPSLGFSLNGGFPYGAAGASVSEAADVNGDGIPDLIVGNPFLQPGCPVCPPGPVTRGGGPSDGPGYAFVVYGPLTLPPSSTYLSHSKQGAAPRKGVSDDSDITYPDSRAFIAFADGDAVSSETVTLTRSNATIDNLNLPADALWEVTTDRDNFTTAALTLRYLDSEVSDLGLSELGMTVYTAEDPAGPWSPLPTTRDPNRNLICGTTTHFSYFALGQVDDGDGVDATVENLVPDLGGGPGTGDGNGDSIPDSDQPNVASLPNAVDGRFITLVSPPGTQLTEINTRTAPAPLPPNTDFPVGLVGFRVTGNLPDFPLTTEILMYLESPPAQPITGHNKFSLRDGYIPFTAPIGPSEVGGTPLSPTLISLRLIDNTPSLGGTIAQTGDEDITADTIYDPSGPTTGGPLLVSLASFTATITTDGVRLDWSTLAEFDNAGFNLYRFDDGLQRLNATIIPAAGLDGSGAAYSYFDDSPVAPGENRLYYLEDVDLNGTRTLHGPISPTTTTTSVSNWQLF